MDKTGFPNLARTTASREPTQEAGTCILEVAGALPRCTKKDKRANVADAVACLRNGDCRLVLPDKGGFTVLDSSKYEQAWEL